MCFAVSPSLRFEVDWNSQTYNSEICIWLTKAWWGNFKFTVTEYSQYFHGGEAISRSQRSIQEAKPSPHTYPVLNYYCKETFFMLNYWKAYDEIILITPWAYQVILSFRRYELCRQPWFDGSPGETSVYCWHNCIWRNWSLIRHVRDLHSSFGLQVVCSVLLHRMMHLLLCNSFQMISGHNLKYGLFT